MDQDKQAIWDQYNWFQKIIVIGLNWLMKPICLLIEGLFVLLTLIFQGILLVVVWGREHYLISIPLLIGIVLFLLGWLSSDTLFWIWALT